MIQQTPVPSTTNILVNQQGSAITRNDSQEEDDDDQDSTSTSFKPLSKINFKKSFCPVFLKKSFDSDSLLGLATESGSESIACDSAIENEASNVVDNIFQDNIENAEKENSETFLVSANSDKVVALKDFAFGNQENFFQLSEDLKIPLNIPKDQSLDIPIRENLPPRSSRTYEDLSLIEEMTEHSSMNSNARSQDATPRIKDIKEEASVHKPKIIKKTHSLESPRVTCYGKMTKVCSDLKLPSKSNPATPREDACELSSKKPLFAQNKLKIVAKRYQRSPPREAKVDSGQVPKPIQTKTGLTLTQPVKEERTMPRSASSCSLVLRSSPQPLDRQISKSTENIPGLIPKYRKQKYDHVQSKVKKYIEDMQKEKTKPKVSESKNNISRSCSSLSRSSLLKPSSEDLLDVDKRPKTADSAILKLQRPEKEESKPLRKSISKSETNLRPGNLRKSVTSPLSKSTFSIGLMGAIYDSSEEELTQLTAIFNDDGLSSKAESLLDLVAKERKSKQEAKKVITELQTSYDDLLQKYAAAENALDKVRFGIKPSDSGAREETFAMAEKVAEKIANFKISETQMRRGKPSHKKTLKVNHSISKDKLVGISNEVRMVLTSIILSRDRSSNEALIDN